MDVPTLLYLQEWLAFLFYQFQNGDYDSLLYSFETSGAADVNQILYDAQISLPNVLPDMTESIATSMTNLIRNKIGQNGSQPLSPQTIGGATKLDTYVHVRWPLALCPYHSSCGASELCTFNYIYNQEHADSIFEVVQSSCANSRTE